MSGPVRRLVNPTTDGARALANEWLVTNGLGGYASGTLSGILTRRYHGLLVAALPAPIGRMVMLKSYRRAAAAARGRSRPVRSRPRLDLDTLSENERPLTLVEFRLDAGLPIWRFEGSGYAIEKRVLMPYRQIRSTSLIASPKRPGRFVSNCAPSCMCAITKVRY